MITRLPKTGFGIGINVFITTRNIYTGEVCRHHTKNLVVKSGRNLIRDCLMLPFLRDDEDLIGEGFTPNYIAIGTDGSTTVDGDTGLHAEVFRKLISLKIPSDSGFKLQHVIDAAEANGSGTSLLKEVALHTSLIGGNCWARATHSQITKTASLAVNYEWIWTISAI